MNRNQIGVVVIGGGYWGQNIIRNLILSPSFFVTHVVESSDVRRIELEKRFGIQTFKSLHEINSVDEIDLIVIATPPHTHVHLVKESLPMSGAILLAKPAGSNLSEAQKILELSKVYAKPVYVDFTYEFSPYFAYLRNNFPELPTVSHIEISSYRTALGKFQDSVSVVGDLAVHDVYIVLRLLDFRLPKTARLLSDRNMESAFCLIEWEPQVSAWIHVSWTSPKKIRFFGLMTNEKAVVIEEMNNENPVQVYELEHNSPTPDGGLSRDYLWRGVGQKLGSVKSPEIPKIESLQREFELLAEIISMKASTSLDDKLFFPNIWHAVQCWKVLQELEKSNVKNS